MTYWEQHLIIILDGHHQQNVYISNNTMLPDYGNCMQYSGPYGAHSTAAYQVPTD